MSLKETYKQLRDLLTQLTSDLEKGEAGNKAAAQRVRTGTVKLEKVAKLYRKESIQSEKKTKGQKKPTKTASNAASSKGGNKSSSNNANAKKSSAGSKGGSNKPSTTASKSKSTTVKAKAKAKATSFRPRQLAIKRATAKLPTRRVAAS